MTIPLDEKKAELLDQIAQRLHEKLPADGAEIAKAFARKFYRGVAPEDMISRDPLDLYGTALAHLRFGQSRRPGEIKVRAYNPNLEQHGWESTHTVVEVVCDDMPFLVDSAGMELNRHGLVNHLIIHPVIWLRRDDKGEVREILAEAPDAVGKGVGAESFMHFEVDRQSDPEVLKTIEADLLNALGDVRLAVADWRQMMSQVDQALKELKPGARHVDKAHHEEVCAFLRWVADNHFTFLGTGCYDLVEEKDGIQLRRVPGSNLGILSKLQDPGSLSSSFSALPPEIRELARDPKQLLVVTKANTRSTVHRPTYLDFIGIKRFDRRGKVIGEHRFLGLFTSAAYNRSPRDIPLLRHKIANILGRSDLPRAGHAGKALQHIIDTYPRDELFQTPEEELFATLVAVMQLQERQRIRLFMRRDTYARFVSCLVFIPRDRYNTALRQRLQGILQDAIGGTDVEYQAHLGESVLARIQFIIRTPGGTPPALDIQELEAQLVQAARSWSDHLREALLDMEGEEHGNRLFAAYGQAFPVAYQEAVVARAAVPDIVHIDKLERKGGDLAMTLYRLLEDPNDLVRFKLIRPDQPIHLSDALPVLENMGLRVLNEQPYMVHATDGRLFAIHDFGMTPTAVLERDPVEVREAFQDAFARVWHDEVENDGFNRLVLLAGLNARQIVVLRAYCKYLQQVGVTFSQAYIEQTLANNPGLAKLLVESFTTRFDPDAGEERDARAAELKGELLEGLDNVANLDEDRIIRRYMQLIGATLRTNFYQLDPSSGRHKAYLSMKFDPKAVPDMPLPRPAFEIFVYSPRVEGVHLRGGPVARGGLRWSDRREDFRTEILGLMKAQMVKNAVIVPVGAKGGFYVKQPPVGGDRAAQLEEGIACYRTFLRGLLDITDNRKGADIIPPERVVRYDGDDPYLVVAADKGTATFSDYANEISREYGFWLDDAFASGGSAGYDHKGMGITARGAWESVKRHFREMGRDSQTDPFTVVGVGDMSGDVFGNGMLLSPAIKLVCAFDHRHIFIDPDPDPEVSFAERQRLFDMGRSSWDDYDRSKISKGGDIYPRTLKSVKLSARAREVLGIEAEQMTPVELINAALKAPVDLLWNGGIGTYVKAAAESHAEAQDRGNDAVRVNAEELRCKVIGEGGNLGVTQRARIAFAQRGGRVNTDFIDNSAGVDCSDHEVNIKIVLGEVVGGGDMTMKQRDKLLADMTDNVAELVLRDNVLQNYALSMSESISSDLLDSEIAFMRRLGSVGRLDRAVEFLPSDEELDKRRQSGGGLTRPERATVMCYAKMTLYDELLACDIPDREYFARDLVKYFPRRLRRGHRGRIEEHRLRREIVATLVANSIVNRGLATFVDDVREDTGADIADIACAYVVARDTFSLLPLWAAVEALPHAVGADRQIAILCEARQALIGGTQWFLHNMQRPFSIREATDRFADGINAVMDAIPEVLGESERQTYEDIVTAQTEQGVDEDLASQIAGLRFLLSACDIVQVARMVEIDPVETAKIYFALFADLSLGHLLDHMRRVTVSGRWDRLAISGLQNDVYRELRRLTIEAVRADLADGTLDGVAVAVPDWLQANVRGCEHCRVILGEIEAAPKPEMPMLAVAVRSLTALGQNV